MVFLTRGGRTWKTRLGAGGGAPPLTLSTGERERAEAEAVERQLRRWAGAHGRRHEHPRLLALLRAKRVTLAGAYLAHVERRLDQFVADAEREIGETDLRPFLADWTRWLARQRKGAGSAARYARKLQLLWGEEPLTTATFTAREIMRRLDALTCADPTRNVYRAACASFGRYLAREGVLEVNPARLVEGYAQSVPRMVHYTRAEAQALLGWLLQPERGAVAFMVAAGLEFQSVERLRARDVTLAEGTGTIFCRATKTARRTRTVRILAENAWALPAIREALQGKVGDALLFPGLTAKRLRMQQYRAIRWAGLAHHTVHDWRHTFAVQAFRDGYSDAVVAHQLGNTVAEVRRTYRQLIPTELDYHPRPAGGDQSGDQRLGGIERGGVNA